MRGCLGLCGNMQEDTPEVSSLELASANEPNEPNIVRNSNSSTFAPPSPARRSRCYFRVPSRIAALPAVKKHQANRRRGNAFDGFRSTTCTVWFFSFIDIHYGFLHIYTFICRTLYISLVQRRVVAFILSFSSSIHQPTHHCHHGTETTFRLFRTKTGQVRRLQAPWLRATRTFHRWASTDHS